MKVFFTQGHARSHVQAAFDLTFHYSGIDDGAGVDHGGHFENGQVTRLHIDFHLGHLHPVDPGIVRDTLT